MADISLDSESARVISANRFPPAAAALIASRLLNKHSPHEIAEAVEVLLDVLNLLDGDPEAEDADTDELVGDEQDAAWIEWTTMRGAQKRGPNIIAGHEDTEEDDTPEDDDHPGQATEDENSCGDAILACFGVRQDGPGCPISDPGEYDGCHEFGQQPAIDAFALGRVPAND